MYWEYTGTAWFEHLDQTEVISDPGALHDAVADRDEANGISWLEPSPANNTYALAVRAESRADLDVKQISDFAELLEDNSQQATLCVAEEFTQRQTDGLPALQQAYGIRFPPDQVVRMEQGEIYDAIDDAGRCNFGEVFATDGRIQAFKLSLLEDDEDFFSTYNPALNVRGDVLDEPRVAVHAARDGLPVLRDLPRAEPYGKITLGCSTRSSTGRCTRGGSTRSLVWPSGTSATAVGRTTSCSARSSGRTIRQFIVGVLLAPSLFTMIWFAVFGAAGIDVDRDTGGAIGVAVGENAAVAFFEFIDEFPLALLIAPLVIFLVWIFFVAGADAGTVVLGSMSSGGVLNPKRTDKLTWGVVMGAIAAILLAAGGLDALQNGAIIAAMPFMLLMVLLCWALLKALKEDAAQAPELRHDYATPRGADDRAAQT